MLVGMRTNRRVRTTPEQYDRYVSEALGAWDDLLISRLLEQMQRRPAGGRLIDLGAGTAALLLKLAALAAFDSVELVATDLFDDMLTVARRRVQEAGMAARVRIEREDVHHLSYPDGYARYVISRSTIHHWADPVAALRETYRILEPGGVALIHDVRRDAPPDMIERLNALRGTAGIGPMLLDEKYTPEEVMAHCQAAGITAARVHTSDVGPEALGFELLIER